MYTLLKKFLFVVLIPCMRCLTDFFFTLLLLLSPSSNLLAYFENIMRQNYITSIGRAYFKTGHVISMFKSSCPYQRLWVWLVLQTALCVEVSGGTDSSVTITLLPYDHGDAPVRVENLCEDVFIKLHQK